jgi:ubiquinone/menaquinone biosynthesis C-methylase UbiE
MQALFNQDPLSVITTKGKDIFCFNTDFKRGNIDQKVVTSFGEEWKKFNQFDDVEINKVANQYFDILNDKIINKNTYGIDIGCGTGRWTRYLSEKVGFMEAVDPSEATLSAAILLKDTSNVRLSKASIDNLPFANETFDFGMSIGVLNFIPDTQKALSDCVKKIKIGGYFYTYIYYNLENRGVVYKGTLAIVSIARKIISSLPSKIKIFVCDLIATIIFMPIILMGRFLRRIGLKGFAQKMPLSSYQDRSFFVIRNDALDRFGTSLEQRFSKAEIETMMKNAGLNEVVIADTLPYWHAVGKRIV